MCTSHRLSCGFPVDAEAQDPPTHTQCPFGKWRGINNHGENLWPKGDRPTNHFLFPDPAWGRWYQWEGEKEGKGYKRVNIVQMPCNIYVNGT
jgi:hypothetical protein